MEVSGPQRRDARARWAKMYSVPPTGPWWRAVAGPLDRVVRPRRTRSVEDLRALEVVPNHSTPEGTAAGARQRVKCTGGGDGGKRRTLEAGEGDAGPDLHKASHFILSLVGEA